MMPCIRPICVAEPVETEYRKERALFAAMQAALQEAEPRGVRRVWARACAWTAARLPRWLNPWRRAPRRT